MKHHRLNGIVSLKKLPEFSRVILDNIGHKYQAVLWDSRANRDKLYLEKRFPQLQGFTERQTAVLKELKPYYNEYTSEVSPDDWAISLELATFLQIFCDITKPKSILDLGSGFSSFVFRRYQATAHIKPVVWTCDDSQKWLKKTRTFLAKHNLSSENLTTLNSFLEFLSTTGDVKNKLQSELKNFDLILHDLGSMESRAGRLERLERLLTVLIPLSSPNGIIILDDIHKPNYLKAVIQLSKHLNCRLYNLRFYTLDSYGRHSALLTGLKSVYSSPFRFRNECVESL